MPAGGFDPEDEQPEPEQISFFDFIDRTVNLALQAHGVWNVEVSETIGEIVKVSQELSNPNPGEFRHAVFDTKKIAAVPAVNREAVIKAIAIYKLVAAEMFAISHEEMEKRVQKYTKEFSR